MVNFKLPIEYIKKNKITENLKVDLELLETTDPKNKQCMIIIKSRTK